MGLSVNGIFIPEKCIILMGTNYSMIKHQFFGYPIFSETHHFHNLLCRFPNILMIICFSRFLSSVFGNGLLPETPSFEGWPPLDQHFSRCFDLPKILRFCVVTRGILQASFHSFSGDRRSKLENFCSTTSATAMVFVPPGRCCGVDVAAILQSFRCTRLARGPLQIAMPWWCK